MLFILPKSIVEKVKKREKSLYKYLLLNLTNFKIFIIHLAFIIVIFIVSCTYSFFKSPGRLEIYNDTIFDVTSNKVGFLDKFILRQKHLYNAINGNNKFEIIHALYVLRIRNDDKVTNVAKELLKNNDNNITLNAAMYTQAR